MSAATAGVTAAVGVMVALTDGSQPLAVTVSLTTLWASCISMPAWARLLALAVAVALGLAIERNTRETYHVIAGKQLQPYTDVELGAQSMYRGASLRQRNPSKFLGM